MLLNDLEFKERVDRAAGTILGLLVGDALGRFATYLLEMEGKSLSTEKFIKRLSEVKDLANVPVSMEAVQIVEIGEELQKCLNEVQLIVSEVHFNSNKVHPDTEVFNRAKAFVAKIDNPYREDPIPKHLYEPSINSWDPLTRILSSVIPLAILSAGDNFSSVNFFEKLTNWVNKDMQFHTKSITICQAALLLAELITISCRKMSKTHHGAKRRYLAEQLVWSFPGLDPFMFHALDFENYINDPVFHDVGSDESIVSLANAFRQYHRTESFKEGLIETIAKGGDIQGNAAICGAVLGAAFGKSGIPKEWLPDESRKIKTTYHYEEVPEAPKTQEKSAPTKTVLVAEPKKKTATKAKTTARIPKAEKVPEHHRKSKERDQFKFYKDAEATAVSLLASPVPEREYIDTLKKNIAQLTDKEGAHKGKLSATTDNAEEICHLLADKFVDFHFPDNEWKYPVESFSSQSPEYSIYEIFTFATAISGIIQKDKKRVTSFAKNGSLDLIVERLSELYKHSHNK
ncbi:MAG: ADP-ribosylglycohydrolase family protein [Deltaproteobacteria bacterium]|jgi:hypothetical protein|nr:ADP-ribosylglycohydrolase family protein [Deltaproteobacteria bacterium]